MNAKTYRKYIIGELIEYLRTQVVASHVEFDASVSLNELGIDSVLLVEILLFVESRFGVVIPDNELMDRVMDPIEKLAHYISEFSETSVS